MKYNSTVALTIVLLVMMLGAGAVSAFCGFTLGEEALKGVTQPEVSPTRKLAGNQPEDTEKKKFKPIPEKEILVKVYDYVHSKNKETKSENQKDEKKAQAPQPKVKNVSYNSVFPLTSEDQGVTMEVVNTSQERGSLLLKVNLRNESAQKVRFLYSFLDIRDEKNRTLSAITDGLPGELPADGRNFSGTVEIPTVLLEDAKQLTLTLTDYPEQKLLLKLSEIPVIR